MTNQYHFEVIGTIKSPYQEKFAIPRQPGLVSAAKGQIILQADANNIDLVRGIEQFSHLWLIFVFHGNENLHNDSPERNKQSWKPLVRPPRLGGNKKMGVLATRSTFRPNPIGMSVVKFDGVKIINKQVILNVSGLDLLNGTPIIDIKPYIPYSDAINNAQAGFAQISPIAALAVEFTSQALQQLANIKDNYPQLNALITQILSQDPRPAYKQGKVDNKIYGMSLYNFNIQWQMGSLTSVVVIKISDDTFKLF